MHIYVSHLDATLFLNLTLQRAAALLEFGVIICYFAIFEKMSISGV